MAILSIPKSSLNLKSQSILRLGTLGNAWDACDLAARCRQSRKAVWVVAATSCFQSPTFPNTQHGSQKSDTCAKLPEIFEAK